MSFPDNLRIDVTPTMFGCFALLLLWLNGWFVPWWFVALFVCCVLLIPCLLLFVIMLNGYGYEVWRTKNDFRKRNFLLLC